MEPRFVAANGLRFGYLSSGNDAAPLVLLAHGFPDTAHTWDAALPALAAAGLRAVAPFSRGYAPTEIPPDGRYDIDTLGRDLLALVDAFGAERAILVGHDWGAIATYAAAALAPTRVRLAVTFAIPHPASVRPTPRLLWQMRHAIALRLPGAAARFRAGDFARVDTLWRRWSPAWADLPAAETAPVKEALRAPGVVEAALAYYRGFGRLPPSLRQPITVPTIAFAGEHDLIAPEAYERARPLFTGGYEVIRVPGGHFMHRERPDVVIPALVDAVVRAVRGAAA